MADIPKEIITFAKDCVNGTHTNRPYTDRSISLEEAYMSQVTGQYITGTGICLKLESGPLTKKDAQKVALKFSISDGNYQVDCIAHNGATVTLPASKSSEELTHILKTVTHSIRNGNKCAFSGAFATHNRDRVFVIDSIDPLTNINNSQMTDNQLDDFITLCKTHKTDPLLLMMRDDTLWAELFARDYLKKAILLYCLSPMRKQDMMHIGIVSSVGEGKDHLIERMIEPLVPVGVASSGKLCTIPGLFGAMSGDDINSIELGLIPKHNNERLAVSEFQTWDDEVFGELMNTMANGYFTMQKGQVDTRRDANANMLFLGNPPHYWDEEAGHEGKDMLQAFGQYTTQIMSRLTLIFTQLSLAGDGAKDQIRGNIMRTMDGEYADGGSKEAAKLWRSFFREYLRKVSDSNPVIGKLAGIINSTYDEIEARPQFKSAFLLRSNNDYRKYQEFTNLIKGFAKLSGSKKITVKHLMLAKQLFEESLITLIDEFPTAAINMGVDYELMTCLELAKTSGRMFDNASHLRRVGDMTQQQLDTLVHVGAITEMSGGDFLINEDFDHNKLEDTR
jgi:hypothetical protein